MLQVLLYRANSNHQALGDLPIGESFSDQLNDLPLTPAQQTGERRVCRSSDGELLQHQHAAACVMRGLYLPRSLQ